MMRAQMPAAGKRARAAIVIDNDGSLPDLEARVNDAWAVLQQHAAAQHAK
jgi:dephospho-CoA kinase